MKAYLFSIALSLFIIVFLSYPTRIDDAFKAFVDIDPTAIGDLVLVSGGAILIGLVSSVVKALKK